MNIRAFRPAVIFPALTLALALACGKNPEPPARSAAPPPVSAAAPPAPAGAEPAGSAPTAHAAAPDFKGRVTLAVDQLTTELGAEQSKLYAGALARGGTKPEAALGVLAFLGQHLERAAWVYGTGVLGDPGNDVMLNNFGVCLHEKALLMRPPGQGGPGKPGPAPATLTLARESLEQAVRLKGDRAVYQSNLGFTLLEIWRSTGDAATLEAAVAALQGAAALDPKSATALAHLAEALAAKGDMAGAAAALEKSRALGPYNGALMSARTRMPQAVNDAYNKASPHCTVNYDCKGVCPRSIIGQVNLVTCEMAQTTAQSACEAGKPHAGAFNCAEQIPKFGILIPGLNSGFSLITPWGRLDMTVDGRGRADFRFKPAADVAGPLGVSLETRGTWSPHSGFSSVEIKPGVGYNLVGGDTAELLNGVGLGPASVSGDLSLNTGKGEMQINAYGDTVLSH